MSDAAPPPDEDRPQEDPPGGGDPRARPRPELDDLAALAADLCAAPMALIVLLDGGRGRVAAAHGLEAEALAGSAALDGELASGCAETLVVPDTSLDERLAHDPLATGAPRARSLAAAPLVSPSGVTIGALCVLDRVPRALAARELRGLRGLARQVVDQLELRGRLRALDRALAQAEAARAELPSQLSLHVRSPMNTVLGMAELLADSALSREQHRYLRVLSNAGQTLVDLIDGLLDLTKLEAGQLTLHHEPFELRPLLEGVLEVLGASAHSKGLALTLDLESGLPGKLVGDAQRLRQVLTQLANAAIRSSQEGGVHVAVEHGGEGPRGDRLRFTIRGCGTCVGAGGSGEHGLLDLSRRLVALLGGELTDQTTPGGERWLRFDLALQSVARADPAPLRSWEYPPKVLLADDLPSERRMVRRLLDEYGCSVLEAENGEQALELFHREQVSDAPFDLILLDARMPTLAGFQAAERLRDVPGALGRTIIMLAADHRSADNVRCEELGLGGRLVKPVSANALQDAIELVLHKGLPSQVARSAPQDACDEPDRAPLHLLLADESEDGRFLVREYLRAIDWEVTEVRSGIECLRAFEGGGIDLVLMDAQLPGMDGFATTRAIRALEAERDLAPTPVLVLTGNVLAEERVRGLEAGCDEQIGKPLRRQVLLEALERHGRALREEGGRIRSGASGRAPDDPPETRERAPVERRHEDTGT